MNQSYETKENRSNRTTMRPLGVNPTGISIYRRLLICNCYVAFSNPKLFVQKLHDIFQ